MTDAEWSLIEPFMPETNSIGRPRETDLRVTFRPARRFHAIGMRTVMVEPSNSQSFPATFRFVFTPLLPVNRHGNGTPDRHAKGTLFERRCGLVQVANRRDPRVTWSAPMSDGAARAGGRLFAHLGKLWGQPRFLKRQDSLPVSMISQ
jgi:hypothetical protein